MSPDNIKINRGGSDGFDAGSSQTVNNSAASPLTSLEEFEVLARNHGAHVIIKPTGRKDGKPFKVGIQSADTGDCGSPGCRCSPGLWVNAFEGERMALALWGQPMDDFYKPIPKTLDGSWDRGTEVDIDRTHMMDFFGFLDALKAIKQEASR